MFHVSLPGLIFRALFVLFCAKAPGIVASQNSPADDKQEGMVQTQMRNVTYHFSDTVVVNIKSLNGELVPLGKNEFPIFDDKNSFNLRISTAEIAIDSSNLANLLNSYESVEKSDQLQKLVLRRECASVLLILPQYLSRRKTIPSWNSHVVLRPGD